MVARPLEELDVLPNSLSHAFHESNQSEKLSLTTWCL
jgi:hypothetical protein